MRAAALFRKHELDLRAQLPVGAVVGRDDVIICRDLHIYRQPAEVKDLADASAERHCPPIAAVGLPVDGEDR